jgi:aryl carrier-like protein
VIVSDLLGRGAVSLADDFFAIGGDSVGAAATVARMRELSGVDIPLSALFGNPGLAAFAAAVDRLDGGDVSADAIDTVSVIAPPTVEPLPAPALARPAPAPPARTPPGDIQSTLDTILAIWRDVLDVPELTPTDDFFALGGHSLKITRVAARVRAELGTTVPLRLLFDNPTVETFAAAVHGFRAAAATPPAEPAARPAPDPAPSGDLDGLLRAVEDLFAADDPTGPGT